MGVLRYLGLNQTGGTHAHFSRMIRQFGIDTSHFVRYQNGAHRVRLKPEQILVRTPRGANRTKPHMLRRAPLEIGRAYKCAQCENNGTWLGQPLSLDVDHIDGDFHNNVAWNLRFLCPNCHSQTSNLAGRSKNKYAHVLPDRVGPRDDRG